MSNKRSHISPFIFTKNLISIQMFFQLTFFTLKRQTWIEDEICFQVNFINGEAFFIFPDVQIEFPHAYVLSMNIVFFFLQEAFTNI